MHDVALAAEAASLIHEVFDSYHAQFRLVTRRARARFARRDWRGAQQDAFERLTLYAQFTGWIVRDLQRLMTERAEDRAIWARMKPAYEALVRTRDDAELARTFFNSVTRRLLTTVGVDQSIEFTATDFDRDPPGAREPVHRTYRVGGALTAALREMLSELDLEVPLRDPAEDAALVATAVERHLRAEDGGGSKGLESVELLPHLFYRNKGAYAVGRLRRGEAVSPLVLPLVHTDRGVEVDAALLTPDEASIVFGFTRSYFHAELGCPRATVDFLRSIMPHKRVDEIYTSLGYNKHGKTELYRNLLRHLDESDTRFEIAEGERGLVMSVFALPSFQIVFKIIKDTFGAPKNTSRRAVMEKYQLVFVRDRVGRLADAQEFEHVAFRKDRFPPEVLEELLAEAGRTVRVEGDRVVFSHLYTERRVTPLNLYLKAAEPTQAVEAVLDYGNAIRDLAAANIFTGDMLLKNFGVTRHGRVIFYDYDELCLLTDCQFRDLPEPTDPWQEMAAEPWYYVGERDVFPEEFRHFLGLPGELGEAFDGAHRELHDVGFWRAMQARQEAGEIVDVFPYRAARRLRAENGDAAA